MSKSTKHTCEEINSKENEIKRVKKSLKSGRRLKPNILIAGTPGTGKSSLCKRLKDLLPADENVKVINLGEFAKENDFLGDWDDKYESHEIDEDKVLDELEDIIATGNIIIEHHVTDFFPERWFDAVFVLRTDSTKLYDRLLERKYNSKKLEDNVQCEIFQTILDEARDSYQPEIVHEIFSNSVEDIETNAKNIYSWINQWIKDNSH